MTKLSNLYQKLTKEDGASAVEFAILVPVLLMIIFGIIQFGLIFSNYLLMAHAAREGIRHMSLHENDALVTSVVRDNTVLLDQSKLEITISPSGDVRPDGETATVELYYPMEIDMPLVQDIIKLSPAWNSTIGRLELRSQATMRIE